MILKLLLIVWLVVCVLLAVLNFSEVPSQIAKDRVFIEKEMKPPVEFIKTFKLEQHRLPTDEEFYKWENSRPETGGVIYIKSIDKVFEDDKSKFKEADWVNNFAIGVWRGEWEEYYFSWNNKYDVNNYTWKDGTIELIFVTVIGIIPLSIFQLFKWRIKLKSSSLKS